jgi:hypothetical protein
MSFSAPSNDQGPEASDAPALLTRRDLLAVFAIVASLGGVGCGGTWAGPTSDFYGKEPTFRSALLSLNLAEIGGAGHTLIVPRKSSAIGAKFEEFEIPAGVAVIFVQDSTGDLRGLALVSDSLKVTIDAETTALSLLFFASGILTTDMVGAKLQIDKLRSSSSFNRLVSELRTRLIASTVLETMVQPSMQLLLRECLDGAATPLSPSREPIRSGITVAKGKDGRSIRLTNEGYRFVKIARQRLDTDKKVLEQTKPVLVTETGQNVGSILRGARPLSWSSLWQNNVGASSIIQDTGAITESDGAAYYSYWSRGPGRGSNIPPKPDDKVTFDDVADESLLTFVSYAILPVLDLAGLVTEVLARFQQVAGVVAGSIQSSAANIEFKKAWGAFKVAFDSGAALQEVIGAAVDLFAQLVPLAVTIAQDLIKANLLSGTVVNCAKILATVFQVFAVGFAAYNLTTYIRLYLSYPRFDHSQLNLSSGEVVIS